MTKIPCLLIIVTNLFLRLPKIEAVAPNIEYSNNMRILKLPKQTKVGSIVYRLKGFDPDPDVLTFGVRGKQGRDLLDIQPVPGSYTEADVYLKKTPDQEKYSITLFVTDGAETTEVDSVIQVTDVPEASNPFLDSPSIIHVLENALRNTSIATVAVKERDDRSLAVKFELRGSKKFAARYVFGPRGISRAEILLLETVDYEKQNLYPIKIIAVNVWSNRSVDTRNVATIEMAVVVDDVQDTPPIFGPLPAILKLNEDLRDGDVVLKAFAEDGDFGDQRPVVYQLTSGSGDAWSRSFSMNASSGELRLVGSFAELKKSFQKALPLTLVIKATEVNASSAFPAMSTEREVTVILVNARNHPPRFQSSVLIGEIEENSPALTAVRWIPTSIPRVWDDDQGRNGTFQVYLKDNSGIFEVHPHEGQGELVFSLLVKRPSGIDFEDERHNKILEYQVVAREVDTPERYLARADIRVRITDANDNYPQFTESSYQGYVAEDAVPGTEIIRVQATDKDSGDFGKIHYAVLGTFSKNLRMDPETGILSVSSTSAFDRERFTEHSLTLEARDDLGRGNRNLTHLLLHVMDANDNEPVFSQPRYDVVLNDDLASFYKKLFVQAYDADEVGQNSLVSYEIVDGNYQNKFRLDPRTGELRLSGKLTAAPSSSSHDRWTVQGGVGLPPIALTVRAHDQGIPVRQATVKVHVHGQEFLNRTLSFVLPLNKRDVQERIDVFERGLSAIIGTPANIFSVAEYNASNENCMVQAWVAYPLNTMLNINNVDAAVSEMLGKSYQHGREPLQEPTRVAGMNYDVLFWVLIALVLLVVLALVLACCYCFCFRAALGNRLKVDMAKIVPNDKTSKGTNTNGTPSVVDYPRMAWRDDQGVWVHVPSEDAGGRTRVKALSGVRGREASPSRTGANAEGRRMMVQQRQALLSSPERPDSPAGDARVVLRDLRRETMDDGGPSYLVVRRDLRGNSGYPGGPRSHAGFYSDMPRNVPRKTEILYIRSPVRDRGAEDDEETLLAPRSVSENDVYRNRRGRREYGRRPDLYYDNNDYAGYSRYPGEMPVDEEYASQSAHVPRSRFRQSDARTLVPISEASLPSSNPESNGINDSFKPNPAFQSDSLEIPGQYKSLDSNLLRENLSGVLVVSRNSGRSSPNGNRPQFYLDDQILSEHYENMNPSAYHQQLGVPLSHGNSFVSRESLQSAGFENNNFVRRNNSINLSSQNIYNRESRENPASKSVRSNRDSEVDSSMVNAESQTPPDLYYRKKSSNDKKVSIADPTDTRLVMESMPPSDSMPPRKFRSVEELANLQELNRDRKFKSQDNIARESLPGVNNENPVSSDNPSRETRRSQTSNKRAALVTNTPIDHIEKEMMMDEDDVLRPREIRQMLDGKILLDNECDEKKLQRRVDPETRLERTLYRELLDSAGEPMSPALLTEVPIEGDLNDSDSGIGGVGRLKLKNSNYMEKKSVFTIAYDGIQTRRLKSEDGRVATP